MARLVDTVGEGDERHLRFVLTPPHWQLSLVLMICWLPQGRAAGRHRRGGGRVAPALCAGANARPRHVGLLSICMSALTGRSGWWTLPARRMSATCASCWRRARRPPPLSCTSRPPPPQARVSLTTTAVGRSVIGVLQSSGTMPAAAIHIRLWPRSSRHAAACTLTVLLRHVAHMAQALSQSPCRADRRVRLAAADLRC